VATFFAKSALPQWYVFVNSSPFFKPASTLKTRTFASIPGAIAARQFIKLGLAYRGRLVEKILQFGGLAASNAYTASQTLFVRYCDAISASSAESMLISCIIVLRTSSTHASVCVGFHASLSKLHARTLVLAKQAFFRRAGQEARTRRRFPPYPS